jgi:transcriptional regulator with XRE-family HTH domain
MPPLQKQQGLGEHVRRLRAGNGLSIRSLAAHTGFSPSFLSQVERGQASPSIASMEKIAAALGVTLGDFFAAAARGEGGRLVRVADRQALTSGWSRAELESLTTTMLVPTLEAVLITLRPGGRSGKQPYVLSRDEFAFVMQGEALLTLGLEEHRMRRGDAAAILAGEPRLWRNNGRAPARILIVASPRQQREPRLRGTSLAVRGRRRDRTGRKGSPPVARRASAGSMPR